MGLIEANCQHRALEPAIQLLACRPLEAARRLATDHRRELPGARGDLDALNRYHDALPDGQWDYIGRRRSAALRGLFVLFLQVVYGSSGWISDLIEAQATEPVAHGLSQITRRFELFRGVAMLYRQEMDFNWTGCGRVG